MHEDLSTVTQKLGPGNTDCLSRSSGLRLPYSQGEESGHLCHSSGLLCSFQSHVDLSQNLTQMNQLNSFVTVSWYVFLPFGLIVTIPAL